MNVATFTTIGYWSAVTLVGLLISRQTRDSEDWAAGSSILRNQGMYQNAVG
jgi:Na+/proline symporter